jgi:ABC-type Fe3+/spermidine/putrescine transport system ATPase subunit
MSLFLDALSKHYGEVRAVDGVTLSLTDGETLALLGPSGCGKSTLLRLTAGLEPPDAGRVVLDGQDVTRVPPQRRRFGMVFQDYALFPHLDVERNVAFGLVERRRPPEERKSRTAELLDLVGLAGLERRRVTELSGGQQQRVALARALAPDPSVLLLDEPLSNLDEALRAALKEELREILGQLDTHAIYVTHDQTEAFTIADRVAVMREGRVVQVGTREELLERPASVWLARFLGHENVFEAEVAGRAQVSSGVSSGVSEGARARPVLLRVDKTRLGGGDAPVATAAAVAVTLREARRTGVSWRLDFDVPAWRTSVVWEGFERELPGPPDVGARWTLMVPEDAWHDLEAP